MGKLRCQLIWKWLKMAMGIITENIEIKQINS